MSATKVTFDFDVYESKEMLFLPNALPDNLVSRIKAVIDVASHQFGVNMLHPNIIAQLRDEYGGSSSTVRIVNKELVLEVITNFRPKLVSERHFAYPTGIATAQAMDERIMRCFQMDYRQEIQDWFGIMIVPNSNPVSRLIAVGIPTADSVVDYTTIASIPFDLRMPAVTDGILEVCNRHTSTLFEQWWNTRDLVYLKPETVPDGPQYDSDMYGKLNEFYYKYGVYHFHMKDMFADVLGSLTYDNLWQWRELYRTITGEYELPVFWKEDWFKQHQDVVLKTWPHISVKHPEMLAITESLGKGHRDLQTRIRIGAFMSKHLRVDQDIVKRLVLEHNTKYDHTMVHFAESAEDIINVYYGGCGSCMSYDLSDYNTDGVYPIEVYGDSDLQVAYIRNKNGSTQQRCLVWPERKLFGRIYGEGPIRGQLEELGYSPGSFVGARIRYIENPARHDGSPVLPYLDNANYVYRNGDWMVITNDEDDADYLCDRTDGTGEPRNHHSCDECGDRYRESELTYVPNEGNICEGCLDEYFVEARDWRGRWIYSRRADVLVTENGEYFVDSDAAENNGYAMTVDDEWYPDNEVYTCCVGDDVYHMEHSETVETTDGVRFNTDSMYPGVTTLFVNPEAKAIYSYPYDCDCIRYDRFLLGLMNNQIPDWLMKDVKPTLPLTESDGWSAIFIEVLRGDFDSLVYQTERALMNGDPATIVQNLLIEGGVA